MLASRPYLLQALYDWIVDSNCTPHILVNALHEGVEVPQEHVKDGQIVLNVAPSAVQYFSMQDGAVVFSARFGGVARSIYVPIAAVLGVYARENGRGMMFDPEEFPEPPPRPVDTQQGGDDGDVSSKKRPALKVVK